MHPKFLASAVRIRPFKPFVVELGNGTRIPIRHPEAVTFGFDAPENWDPDKSNVVVTIREPNGDWWFYFPEQIAALHFPEKRRNDGNSRPHKSRRNG